MSDRRAGFTLLEVLIAIAIIGMIVSLVYGAFAGTAESKEEIEDGNDIYHQARWALDKMEADLSTAYLSNHPNSYTLFYGVNLFGSDDWPLDEIHFHSFNHVKYNPAARESDQCEVSYYVMENPDTGQMTLYRREDPTPDDENMAGGEIYELADSVLAFNLRYFDGFEWADEWDSRDFSEEEVTETQVEQYDEMINTLPMAVEATIILAGPRETEIAFHTKIRVVLSSIDLSMIDEEEVDEEELKANDTSGAPKGPGSRIESGPEGT